MDEFESLSHSRWECKYHVVFIPKGRRKALFGQVRPYLGEALADSGTKRNGLGKAV